MYILAALFAAAGAVAPMDPVVILEGESEEEIVYLAKPEELALQEIAIDDNVDDFYSEFDEEDDE